MKKIFTLLLILNFLSLTHAQLNQWAKSMGGTGHDYGNSIVADNSGNVYVTGSFNGTADFDPSASAANLVSAGSSDIFIAINRSIK